MHFSSKCYEELLFVSPLLWHGRESSQMTVLCSLEMLLASSVVFLQFSDDFGYGHSAQSVKAVISPSCLAWISLWPLAVISPSSPRVFPIPDLPVSWHQADQRLGAAGGITVQRPLLSQWETRTRREPDRNCSFFHLPGRLFWGVPYVLLGAPGRVSHQSTMRWLPPLCLISLLRHSHFWVSTSKQSRCNQAFILSSPPEIILNKPTQFSLL